MKAAMKDFSVPCCVVLCMFLLHILVKAKQGVERRECSFANLALWICVDDLVTLYNLTSL